MTQEEKAKAYDEALEKARFYHGNCPSEPERKKLEKMFPQLAESEDERIKNLIYCIVRDRGDVGKLLEANGCPVEKALSWLEKQKEQKAIDDDTREKIISRAKSEKQVVLLSESDSNAEIGWDTRSLEDAKKLLEYGIAFINKQLGTKPAEKQDYSGLTDFERAIHRGFLCAGVENVPLTIIKETARDCLAQIEQDLDFANQLKQIRKEEKEANLDKLIDFWWNQEDNDGNKTKEIFTQAMKKAYFVGKAQAEKPAEWSEDIIQKAIKEVGLTQYQINWFKTNVFPPKQEWSKEDEVYLQDTLWCIEQAEKYAKDENDMGNCWCARKFLKFFCPSLKPSENADIHDLAYERYPIRNMLVREVTKDVNDDLRDGFIDGYEYAEGSRWKPSEEQMNMLYAYAYGTPDKKDAAVLYSLYMDLDKLRKSK